MWLMATLVNYVYTLNYTVTQLPVGRLIAHDPATCTHSVTLMEGSKREKQQVVRWDDLPPYPTCLAGISASLVLLFV